MEVQLIDTIDLNDYGVNDSNDVVVTGSIHNMSASWFSYTLYPYIQGNGIVEIYSKDDSAVDQTAELDVIIFKTTSR